MICDVKKYRRFLDDFDLSDDQKDELIKGVWSAMESFVDQAFGLHPVQHCQDHAQTVLQDSGNILDSMVSKEGSEK